MLMEKNPLFMENDKWFYWDDELLRYMLTDEAPEEARESYEQYYAAVRGMYDFSAIDTIRKMARGEK